MNRRAVVIMLVASMVSIALAVLALGGSTSSNTGTPGSGHPNSGVNGELFCSSGQHHPPGSTTTCVPDSP